ncbi:hypothetical protein BDQ17DRAFT_1412575 [Cyathus striatus]|nr:hypothetical protein BDQ17DRAFT_1412575 [Cyathus striatus]
MMSNKIKPSTLKSSLVPLDPTDISEEDEANVLYAIADLRTLAEYMAGHILERKEQPLKTSELHKYWKAGLFSWFTFLFDYYHPPTDSRLPTRWDVISYVSCDFTYFIKEDYDLVSSTVGTAQLATRLWLVKDYDCERSNYSFYCGWWDAFFGLFCRSKLDPRLLQEMYDVEGVNRRAMISLILARIESSKEIEHLTFLPYTKLTGVLSHFKIFEPSVEVPVNRIVRVLASTVKFIVFDFFHAQDVTYPTLDACLQYFNLLESILSRADSIEAANIAIRSGLLAAFVPYSYYFDMWMSNSMVRKHGTFESTISTVTKLITTTIPKYMVFSSVLSAIQEDLKDTSEAHMPQTIVAQEWENFRRLLDSNLRFLDQSNLPRLCLCDNPKARYCSKECQVEDWADFHRHACHTAGELKDALIPHNILRKRDHISVCHFAIMSAIMQWESIKERAQREHPGKTLWDLTILFNFTRHPHEVRLVKRGFAAGGATRYIPYPVTVIQCHISLGLYRLTITTVGDIEELETMCWVSGAPEIVAFSVPLSQIRSLPPDSVLTIE